MAILPFHSFWYSVIPTLLNLILSPLNLIGVPCLFPVVFYCSCNIFVLFCLSFSWSIFPTQFVTLHFPSGVYQALIFFPFGLVISSSLYCLASRIINLPICCTFPIPAWFPVPFKPLFQVLLSKKIGGLKICIPTIWRIVHYLEISAICWEILVLRCGNIYRIFFGNTNRKSECTGHLLTTFSTRAFD
jgi:hypothetical protein